MSTATKIAIIDDEQDMRQSISQWLGLSGFETETFASAEAALKSLGADYPGVVMSDIKMPGMDGMALLKRLMGVDNALPVVMITGHGDVPMAVEAMRIGAFDFLEKPFNPDKVTDLARRAGAARRLALENRALRRELSDASGIMERLAGASPAMERLREDVLDLGQADGHVLIEGETGTGKTLAAHALHAVGPRANKPFIAVSCNAYTEAALAAKLFGSDDPEAPLALTAEARGGTLCLENIEALPEAVQARLLSFLDAQDEPSATRIVAVSNLPGAERSAEEVLRPDLFYRLAALRITTPPLRNRDKDILTLFARFAERYADEYGCAVPELSPREAAQLLQAPWPGNIRQLENLAERAVLQSRREAGTISSLLMADSDAAAAAPVAATPEGRPLKKSVEAFERMLIDNTMRRHHGSVTAVMDELSLPRRTLNEKMAKYGLNRSEYV